MIPALAKVPGFFCRCEMLPKTAKPTGEAVTKTILVDLIDSHPENYNLHPADQIAQLQDSVRFFGYIRRIVVQSAGDRFVCVAGNGMLQALKMENYREIEATVIPASWTKAQVLAYLVADNMTAEDAKPDFLQLRKIVDLASQENERYIDAMGITPVKMEKIVKMARRQEQAIRSKTKPVIRQEIHLTEKKAAIQKKWQVAPGQVWQLGGHFLACGDFLDDSTLGRLFHLADVGQAKGIFTSPPYADQRSEAYPSVPASQYVAWFERVAEICQNALDFMGSFFVNIDPHVDQGARSVYVEKLVVAMVEQWGWLRIDTFTWDKKTAIPGRWPNRFRNQTERIYHFSREAEITFIPENVLQEPSEATVARLEAAINSAEGERRRKKGIGGASLAHASERAQGQREGVFPSNLISMAPETRQVPHEAPFPPELPAFFMMAFSNPGATWLDPFSGSGSTIRGAEIASRHGLGVEIVPENVAVSLELFHLAHPDLAIEKVAV